MPKKLCVFIFVSFLLLTSCNTEKTTFITQGADTYIESSFPRSNNFAKDYIAFGNCGSATDYARTLLKFDVSESQGASSNGILTLTWKEKGTALKGSEIEVYLMSEENYDFGEGASFDFKDVQTQTPWTGSESHLSDLSLITTYKKWKPRHKAINVRIPKSVINNCIQNKNGIISLLIKVENDEDPVKVTETKWFSSESPEGKPVLKFASK